MDIKGKTYGQLTVVSFSGANKWGSKWNCVCECGNRIVVLGSNLTGGYVKSCGCTKKAVSRRHGMSYSVEYSAYICARARCTNSNNSGWKNFGGRGIRFRFESFEQFYAELGPRPKGKILARMNNHGHYEPGNVCWTTRGQQRPLAYKIDATTIG